MSPHLHFAPVASQDISSFDAMVREQAAARRQQQIAARAAAVAATEASHTGAVPARVRLLGLLGEAYRHEYHTKCCAAKAAAHKLMPAQIKQRQQATLDAYCSLAQDVRGRLRVLDGVDPVLPGRPPAPAVSPQQMHKVVLEAVGCFGSMLPWSEGIVSPPPPRMHTAFSSPSLTTSGALTASNEKMAATPEIETNTAGETRQLRTMQSAPEFERAHPLSLPPEKTAFAYLPGIRNAPKPPSRPAPQECEAPPARPLGGSPDHAADAAAEEWKFPTRLSYDSQKMQASMVRRQSRLAELMADRRGLVAMSEAHNAQIVPVSASA